MNKLRSVGGLLAICGAFSCATAISDGTVPGPNTPPDGAGSDAGGGAGLAEEGGSPATGGSAPQTGGSSPGTGGKGEAGKGGMSTGSGGKSGGSGGSVGKGGSGNGGSVGTGGSVSVGGKGGTGSGGAGPAGGSSAGGSGPTAGYCDNPTDLPSTATNTGNIGTAAACFRVKATFNTIVCSNMADRTVKVNGMAATCGVKSTFPPAIDGWSYFDITAGAMSYAQVGWFSS